MSAGIIQTLTCLAAALSPTLMLEAAESASAPAAQATPTKFVVVDGFESYTNDQQLAKVWYKPLHGGAIHQLVPWARSGSPGYAGGGSTQPECGPPQPLVVAAGYSAALAPTPSARCKPLEDEL